MASQHPSSFGDLRAGLVPLEFDGNTDVSTWRQEGDLPGPPAKRPRNTPQKVDKKPVPVSAADLATFLGEQKKGLWPGYSNEQFVRTWKRANTEIEETTTTENEGTTTTSTSSSSSSTEETTTIQRRNLASAEDGDLAAPELSEPAEAP